MDWMISILAGAIGGTVAGSVFFKLSLGRYFNSIVGALTALVFMLASIRLINLSSDGLVNALISSVVVGFLAMPIAGILKKSLKK